MAVETRTWQTVKLDVEDGIGWITLNRPEKRNAMSPTLHLEMNEVLDEVESDPAVKVVILTGAGEAWCAGQDLKQFFRELDNNPKERRRVGRAAQQWRWHRLYTLPKPTIAMVNGYCFGGGFTQLIACDLAIAADEAVFGLSEVNWGIFPGGLVSRVLADCLSYRETMWYILTGDTFDGKKAAQMQLVNRSVPRDQLRDETLKLAQNLLQKNPAVLSAAKEVFKTARTMDYWQAEEYMQAKGVALRATDPEKGRDKGITQFIDEKRYRPGLGAYIRDEN